MTRLIFVPDENTLMLLDSPLKPDDLVHCVQNDLWKPPPPFGEAARSRLQAVRLGTTVIITPLAPGRKTGSIRRRTDTRLTRRQKQVLMGLAEGLTSSQIALQLNVNVRTVEFHINTLKTRLGTYTRSESVSRASALGLLDQDEK